MQTKNKSDMGHGKGTGFAVTFFYSVNDINQRKISSTYSDKTTRQINHLFRNSIWREICYFCQTGLSPDNTVNYTDFKVTIRRRKSCEWRMHVLCPSLWAPALRGKKRRESMYCRLKIASVGLVIIWKSGNGGFVWFLEVAGACNKELDKTKYCW